MYYGTLRINEFVLYAKANDDYLLALSFDKFEGYEEQTNEIIKMTLKQLEQYFNKERKDFELPLHLEMSDFELAVLKAMSEIPYGRLSSYKTLAIASKRPKAYRAVGSVCNKNPYPIIIPCHRVLKADQSLGGYAFGDDIKIKLLELEGHEIKNNRVF